MKRNSLSLKILSALAASKAGLFVGGKSRLEALKIEKIPPEMDTLCCQISVSPPIMRYLLERSIISLEEVDLLNGTNEERRELLLSKKIINEQELTDLHSPWLEIHRTMYLLTGLITIEQADRMRSIQLRELLTDNGMTALIERLITIEQADRMLSTKLPALLTDNGIEALRNQLITIEQADQMRSTSLYELLTDNGMIALKEGLITIEQSDRLDGSRLHELFTYNGIEALRERFITIEQASSMYQEQLHELFTNNGIEALRDKLITIEEAGQMGVYQLREFLRDAKAQSQPKSHR